MSKIGRQPIILDPEVTATLAERVITIKGPKGEAKLDIPRVIKTEIKDNKISFVNSKDDKKSRALHGLIRTLLANFVSGVKTPWQKTLEIHGVGFRAKLEGNKIVFNLGFSHPVNFEVPPDVSVNITGNNLVVSGINKQRVGEVSAAIKRIRRPDKYKGKGLRYKGEVLKLKPGKKAKTAA